jgi:hypothetical protein
MARLMFMFAAVIFRLKAEATGAIVEGGSH